MRGGREGSLEELILPQQDNVNQAVATGRAAAMAADNALTAYYAQVQPDVFMAVDAVQLQPEPVGVAVSKADPRLAIAIEAALDSLHQDGTLQTILAAWSLGAAGVDDPAVNPVG